MSEKLQNFTSKGLWISTLVIIALMIVQSFSGNWVTIFLIWPGGPGDQLGQAFTQAMAGLSAYHAKMGFAIGVISILILVLAFVHKSSVYVRIFAVLGFIITASAAMGGILYVNSGYQDRWSLGQMMDSFVGAYGAYFLQLFFMNRTPRFPWSKSSP